MDFSLTEEQELLLESVDDLMERYGTEQYFKECDEAHRWPKEFTDALLENGFQMLGVDEKFGGMGLALRSYETIDFGMHGFDQCISLTLPALSVLYLKRVLPKKRKKSLAALADEVAENKAKKDAGKKS